MPKQKSNVFSHYKQEGRDDYRCKFCKNVKYKKHATRMKQHLKECSDVPIRIKNSFEPPTKKARKNQFFDSITPEEQDEGNKLLARFIYNSGSPFRHVEHPDFIKFITFLRPSFKVPSRKEISGNMLDKEFDRLKVLIDEKISTSPYLSLQLDSWTNIRNENITHVVMNVGSKAEPIFLYGELSKENKHDTAYMFDIMERAVEKYGSDRVTAIVTDNHIVMVKAGERIEQKFENVVHVRCACHSIHLLIGKILESGSCKLCIQDCKDIVKCVKNKCVPYAIFCDKKGTDRATLHLPGATRWGSTQNMLNSLIKFRSPLEQTVVEPTIRKEVSEIKNIVLNEQFWEKVGVISTFLQPFLKWIRIFEENNSRIYLAVECFQELTAHFNNYLDNPIIALTEEEKNEIAEYFKTKEVLTLKPIHYAAHFLDPRKQGLYLSAEESMKANEYMYSLALSMPDVDPLQLAREIGHYKLKEGVWGSGFIWSWIDNDENKNEHPKTWWLGVGPQCSLSKIAARILSTPIASALTERSFSSRSFIHSKLRNQLKNETAEKNLFLYANSRLFSTVDNVKTPQLQARIQEAIQENSESSEEEDDPDYDFDYDYNSPDNSDSDDVMSDNQ